MPLHAISESMATPPISVEEANATATKDRRFQFVRRLGSGGFGTVFLARDKQNAYGKPEVAIKLIQSKEGTDTLMSYFTSQGNQALRNATNEVYILSQLEHPNVIKFLDAYVYRDTRGDLAAAIITYFYEKGDLCNYLSQGNRLDRSKRLQWFQQLAEGLKYIHSRGIVHRDIKPPNILISSEETLKIGDVGIAKPLYDIQSQLGIIDQPLHEYLRSKIGTEGYVAPEVLGKHYNEKSDVFSLGLVFVQLIEALPVPPRAQWSGEKLYLGEMYDIRSATRHLKPSHLLQLTKGTTDEVKLCDHMLVYKYKERLSAQDVLEEVKVISSTSEAPSDSSSSSCCFLI